MNPATVRDALKTNLATITGLRTYDIMPDAVNVPAAVVGQLSLFFDTADGRGLDRATVEIYAITSRMVERSGQDKLDGLLTGSGSGSIKAAIESDKTLGGACNTLRVTSATPGQITVGAIEYLGYNYSVEIYG